MMPLPRQHGGRGDVLPGHNIMMPRDNTASIALLGHVMIPVERSGRGGLPALMP